MVMTEGSVKLSDGSTVAIGETCFNYYDMKTGHFTSMDENHGFPFDGWGDFVHDDGSGIKILNGERVCSLEHARSMGWLEEEA